LKSLPLLEPCDALREQHTHTHTQQQQQRKKKILSTKRREKCALGLAGIGLDLH
jgi:hypothetical protein